MLSLYSSGFCVTVSINRLKASSAVIRRNSRRTLSAISLRLELSPKEITVLAIGLAVTRIFTKRHFKKKTQHMFH